MATAWLPFATRKDWGRTGPRRNRRYPWRGVQHTTEGRSLPSYGNGASQPHTTIEWRGAKRRGFDVWQHQTLLMGARALVDSNAAPVNSTNTFQCELIGSCDRKYANRYNLVYLPDLGDDFLADLGHFWVKILAVEGVDPGVIATWVKYPASYGVGARQRLSWSQWRRFSGILGHEHVPINFHGDPGDLNLPRALALAGDSLGTIGRDNGVIDLGDCGPKVKALQALLNGHGADVVVDGVFLAATLRAVRARQRAIGVVVDGVWGPASIAANIAAGDEPAPAGDRDRPAKRDEPKHRAPRFTLPKGNAYAMDDGTQWTHSGIRDNDDRAVRRIQRRVGADVDGIYGPRTKAHVERWQQRHGLTVDGEVGPVTWRAMFG